MAATVEITAQNQWTDEIEVPIAPRTMGILIQDDLAAGTAITLQAAVIGTSNWRDVETFNSSSTTLNKNAEGVAGLKYRLGCKTGGFASGDTPEITLK